MMPYPAPHHAAYVWAADGRLRVAFEGTEGARGHTLDFDLTERGITALYRTLCERAAHGRTKLGQPGTPTQYDIDAVLRTMQVTRCEARSRSKVAKQPKAYISLEELGL